MKNRSKKAVPLWRKPKFGLAVLGTLILVIAVLELTNTTHIFHKPKAVSGTITSTNPSAPSSSKTPNQVSSPTQSSTSPSNDSAKSSTAISDSSGPLIAPYGSFVSNHQPSLSNQGGVPSMEQSVCTTTPGANCTITFTFDGVTKNLEAQTADSKGSVYWNWDVKKSGFTEGQWTITATATSNGQSKNTSDSLKLTVNP